MAMRTAILSAHYAVRIVFFTSKRKHETRLSLTPPPSPLSDSTARRLRPACVSHSLQRRALLLVLHARAEERTWAEDTACANGHRDLSERRTRLRHLLSALERAHRLRHGTRKEKWKMKMKKKKTTVSVYICVCV